MAFDELGRYGVWLPFNAISPEQAREVEELGYGALWLGSSPGEDDLVVAENLLAATENLTVATSIVNIWKSPAAKVAEVFHRIEAAYPGRFLLGIGAGHPEANATYRTPYDALVEYFDELDAAGVPKERRALAALGPRVLKLARDRSLGALPYLVPVEHTASARAILGDGTLLATEHKVVIDDDPVRARTTAEPRTSFYLGLQNYVTNLRRFGLTDEDLAKPGSDRFYDAVVAHGTAEAVAEKLRAHLLAGADHVAIQPLSDDPLPALRTLAPLLK
ncbi:LLM class F420-dependent oxidoreductase [Nocardia sp. XZ_19_385]|uniref:LLM class F420-dependent oxidoreductase n=1 Tax=Nocardia sp. XZ_19_385 TaxID=2769488 RepID=UPI00188F0C67|nr:LLM class F420-dependent oxidoreductase [Nocardia sp. XZ_19_385]